MQQVLPADHSLASTTMFFSPTSFGQIEPVSPEAAPLFQPLFKIGKAPPHSGRRWCMVSEPDISLRLPPSQRVQNCFLALFGASVLPAREVDFIQYRAKYDALYQREWRLVSDEEVERKLQQCIIRSFSHQESYNLPFISTKEPVCSIRANFLQCDAPYFFCAEPKISEFVVDNNAITIHWQNGRTALRYFVFMDPHFDLTCLHFIRARFHSILSSALSEMPRPCKKMAMNSCSVTRAESYLWNALKLTVVSLQEQWVQTDRGEHGMSAVSLCCVLCIGTQIWCVQIGENQALVISAKERTIWSLGERMDFSDRSLTYSIKKRGGNTGRDGLIEGEGRVELDHVLPMPRVLGAVQVAGVGARPKITRLVFQKKGSVVILFGNMCFMESFSKRELLSAIARDRNSSVSETDRILRFVNKCCLSASDSLHAKNKMAFCVGVHF